MNIRVLVAVATLSLALAFFLVRRGPMRSPAGPLAVAAASAAITRAPGGCELLSERDLEEILAVPLDTPRRRGSVCEYRVTADGGTGLDVPLVTVGLRRSITKGAFEAETEREAALLEATPERIPGLGEEAFRTGSGRIAVYVRGAAVSVGRRPTVDDAKATEIARRAIARIPPNP